MVFAAEDITRKGRDGRNDGIITWPFRPVVSAILLPRRLLLLGRVLCLGLCKRLVE